MMETRMMKDANGHTWFERQFVTALLSAAMLVGLGFGGWVGITLVWHHRDIAAHEASIHDMRKTLTELSVKIDALLAKS